MDAHLTRREFLQSLVPSWCTRQNIKTACIIAAGLLLASAAVSVAQSAGFLGTLKTISFAVGCALVLWLGVRLAVIAARLVEKSPAPIASFLVVAGQMLSLIIVGSLGARVFYRWQQGKDITENALTLVIFFIFRFADEWAKRSNPKAEPTAQD